MYRITPKITIVGISLFLTSLLPVNAQDDASSKKLYKQAVPEDAPTLTEQRQSVRIANTNTKLVADKAKMKLESMAIDSILMDAAADAEELLFPADDLYNGKWDNTSVKAYGDLSLPDQQAIDVSQFVLPAEGRVTSKYGWRRRRMHYGTDIKVQTGDTIKAAFDGKIRVKRYEKRGYGYYLVLRHSNGLETVYGHLSKFLVEENDYVKAGEPIALGGNTGRSSGSHLHFEMRFLGQAINPEEIVDFENGCVRDDQYVFVKGNNTPERTTVASGKTQSKTKSVGKKGNSKYYKIKNGDTLGVIARRNGTTVNRICKLNNIKPTTTLKIGRSLRIS